ncbi:GH32 C-terminal domain-containing protein [uncultured Faecalibaculum sp.]|uniref:GH32 C-terminal domain-containing protein n=1 Tax=uncultured Faecalibaculum sp. TaxID=1729681 RepID=UPI00341989C8
MVSNISFSGTQAPEAQFRTNLTNLKGLQGTWKETEEGLFSSGGGDNFAISDTVAKNVEFSATITNKEKKGAGSIAIRCTDNPRNGGYFINADYSAGIFKLFSFPSGATVASAPMASVPENEDGSYKITIQMVDDQIRVFVNGVGIINVKDTQHPSEGRLGLLTWDSTVVYQDVTYKVLDSMADMEEAKLTGLKLLTEGTYITEAIDPAITIYGLDVESGVSSFSLKPEGTGTITVRAYDRDMKLIRDLGDITDTIDLTDEDFRDSFMNLYITVTNDMGFAKDYLFTVNKWISYEDLSKEEYRPQFHVTPITNFMNDPNGMVYDSTDGYWHMFYQYQPQKNGGGKQAWGHVRSKDLVNWEQLPLAIQRDDNGLIYSGSAIEDRNNTSGFFTDNKEGESRLIAYFTYDGNGAEQQGMAYSKDHGMTWIKCGIILDKTISISGYNFRDPKVFQVPGDNDHWYMVTAGGSAQIFVSSNLKDWTRSQNLTYKNGSQIESECPMMYPATDEETGEDLWIYGGSAGFYVVGKMEKDDKGVYKWTAISDKLEVESNENPWGGFGKYATMTFYNPDDERTIGVSWLQDSINAEGKGYDGVQSLPHSYSLRKINGKYVIVSYVVDEVNQLRDMDNPIYQTEDKTVTAQDGNILEGCSGITYDVEGVFDVTNSKKAFGFRLRQGSDGEILFSYDPATKKMILDLRTAGGHRNSGCFTQTLEPDADGKIHLRLIIDQGAVEAFGNYGEANISTVLVSGTSNLGMEFFTEDEVTIDKLDILEMKSMYSGASKAETEDSQLYLSAPSYAETNQEFTVRATLYPDKSGKGVTWTVPEALEVKEETGGKIVLVSAEEGEWTITASAGDLSKDITVRTAAPDFANNADGWKATAGKWYVDDQGLHGKNEGTGDCFYLNDSRISAGESFSLTSNIKVEKGQAAGIVFGVRDPNNPGGMWYCANIDAKDQGGIFKMFRNTGGQDWYVSKKISEVPANEDGSYDLEVTYDADSGLLTYLVNGVEIGSHTANFANDCPNGGYTGYVTFRADALFNDFALASDAAVDPEADLTKQALQDIEIELDTTHTLEHFYGHEKIPAAVTVKLTNGTLLTVPVNWNTDDVKFGTPGVYTATGTLDLPALYAKDDEAAAAPSVKATVTIKDSTPAVDKGALQQAVDDAAGLKETDYTADSWKDFDKALTDAKAVLANETATQETVDNAARALAAARDGLKKAEEPAPEKADLTALTNAVEAAKALKEADYTPETWAAFQEALAKAQDVLKAEDPAQADVDAALKALTTARDALKLKDDVQKEVDKSKLEETVKEAEGIKASGYTDASWKAFQSALKDAKAILERDNATQDEVDKALKALTDAKAGLTKAGTQSGTTTGTRPATSTTRTSGSKTAAFTAAGLWTGLMAAAAAAVAVIWKKKRD